MQDVFDNTHFWYYLLKNVFYLQIKPKVAVIVKSAQTDTALRDSRNDYDRLNEDYKRLLKERSEQDADYAKLQKRLDDLENV